MHKYEMGKIDCFVPEIRDRLYLLAMTMFYKKGLGKGWRHSRQPLPLFKPIYRHCEEGGTTTEAIYFCIKPIYYDPLLTNLNFEEQIKEI